MAVFFLIVTHAHYRKLGTKEYEAEGCTGVTVDR